MTSKTGMVTHAWKIIIIGHRWVYGGPKVQTVALHINGILCGVPFSLVVGSYFSYFSYFTV